MPNFEKPDGDTPGKVEGKPEYISEEEKARVLKELLDIANDPEYKIEDRDERKWLSDLHKKLKEISLRERFGKARTDGASYYSPAGFSVAELGNLQRDCNCH